MRKALTFVALAALVAVGAVLFVTRPTPVNEAAFSNLTGSDTQGELVFIAAGCASCHHAPDAKGEAKLVLAGGQRFVSDFGTFVAPNISPDPQAGIGGWTLTDFASAVTRGVSPEGQHLYPAFPYSAYTHMVPQDVADLWAYLRTLPASDVQSQPHEVGFPFNIRLGLGLWKMLFMSDQWVVADTDDESLTRGRYLVEALAHCGECHTPRNVLGGLQRNAWLSGAENPDGPGRIPALTPDKLTWSETDIAYYLETGFTPDFDSVGGHMVEVVENFGKLPASDRAAVAAYLKALPEPAKN
ncbi:c-type cytochrome [Puniceibacterium sediminis]|uniref:Cytochrome c, mono- and diheme variants n=1 Tax=Puniceibacterium sediminis TaxID=1608407 RepID=A0A238YJW7_9RHOB|nr:cytochrome c [Puniceibacterium sediminis]SNR70923.1 Cytochrome c, mono- and diheme variants [Puniceibacterium sediminis]